MHVRSAKLCLDCEEVFQEDQCPRCGTDSWIWVTHWIRPMKTVEVEVGALDRLQAMAGLRE